MTEENKLKKLSPEWFENLLESYHLGKEVNVKTVCNIFANCLAECELIGKDAYQDMISTKKKESAKRNELEQQLAEADSRRVHAEGNNDMLEACKLQVKNKSTTTRKSCRGAKYSTK